MKHLIVVAIAGLIALWNAPTALAGACRNVEIHVHRDVAEEIKIVDVDYFDANSGQWREENFVGNEIVTDDYQFERDLEYVGNEWVYIRIWFKWRSSDINPWSSPASNAISGAQACQDGEHFDVHINNIVN